MYKIIKTPSGESIQKSNGDGSVSYIPMDLANSDYQVYLAWLAEGNTPLPPDEEAPVE
jgi:hypothetical protein